MYKYIDLEGGGRVRGFGLDSSWIRGEIWGWRMGGWKVREGVL